MRTRFAALALSALALVASAPALHAQAIGSTPPEFVPAKWYKSPPLTLEQLHGKAVLVVIFRTW